MGIKSLILSSLMIVFISYANLSYAQSESATASTKVSNSQLELAQPGQVSPDWQLDLLDGSPLRLSEFRGQAVILVFWATWCPYCKKLLPGIQRLHEKYGDKGLKIIAVNIREDWKPEVYWRNHEYTFDAVLDGDRVAKMYGVKGTPGLVFLDIEGNFVARKAFSDPNHPLLEKFAQRFIPKPQAK